MFLQISLCLEDLKLEIGVFKEVNEECQTEILSAREATAPDCEKACQHYQWVFEQHQLDVHALHQQLEEPESAKNYMMDLLDVYLSIFTSLNRSEAPAQSALQNQFRLLFGTIPKASGRRWVTGGLSPGRPQKTRIRPGYCVTSSRYWVAYSYEHFWQSRHHRSWHKCAFVCV